jgi:hypothetical protein
MRTNLTISELLENELTTGDVVRICGNNENRIFKVARLIAGYWQKESVWIAAMKIADELNGGSDPEGTLRLYIESNKL